ncbi:Photosystem I chlorophyll a apoprotein A2 [compost metagenome]
MDRSKTLYVTLKLGVCDLKEGEAFVVKNIFYDFDASAIRPDAAIVLDNIVRVMKDNPRMTIELSSHTDSRGERQYNQSLSQQRAEAAVNYLVSKGIARKRLVAKGYGENRLVNNCADGVNCTEEEHEQNRRTEIKVLKY